MFNQKLFTIMKKNQFTFAAVTFITGIILGASVIGLFSFSNRVSSPALLPGASKISESEANALFRNYYQNATPTNGILKGFTLTREHLSSLNSLASENPGLPAFRVYMGYDQNIGNIGIIVGVNNAGQDVTGAIYKAPGGSSPCPPICDGASSITRN
jgi:hypothetical protein